MNSCAIVKELKDGKVDTLNVSDVCFRDIRGLWCHYIAYSKLLTKEALGVFVILIIDNDDFYLVDFSNFVQRKTISSLAKGMTNHP